MIGNFLRYFIFLLVFTPGLALASFSIRTTDDAGYNVPTNRPSIRTIDFTTITLEQDRLAGRLDYSKINRVNYTASMTFPGFSGNTVDIDSTPTNDGDPGSQLIVNFLGGGTKELSFLWGLNVIDQESYGIIIRLSNGSHRTLTNCRDSTFDGCISYYLAQSFVDTLINFFYEMVGVVRYKPVYVRFVAPSNLRITRISFVSFNVEENSGSLWTGAPASQSFHLDNLSYVDATAKPDHVQILTDNANVGKGLPFELKVKACFDAQCSAYTSGVLGKLNITGSTSTATVEEGGNFFIQPGSSGVDISAALTGSGASVVSISDLDPDVTKVYCGFGQPATNTSSCSLNLVNVLHHVEIISSSAQGLTCTPDQITIRACSNESCSVRNTSGVSGTLTVTGVVANYLQGQNFTIPEGQSEITMDVHLTTVGTASFSLSNLSVIPSNGSYCGFGQNPVAGACSKQIADAGLLISAVNDYSGKNQTLTIAAVKKSDQSSACVPAFSNTQKSIEIKCSYLQPSSGTTSALVGGLALNAANDQNSSCSSAGRVIPLNFNSQGVASTTLMYPDAGQIKIDFAYKPSAQETGLVLQGALSLVFAPYTLEVTANAPQEYIAGEFFSVSFKPRNFLNEITPNFGKETSALNFNVEFLKRSPSGASSVDGVFSRINDPSLFDRNNLTIHGLSWSEVGSGDLQISLNSPSGYLGSGLAVQGITGTTGVVGPFRPSHFELVVSEQGCGSFTYNRQPFGVEIRAKNKQNNTVVNYDGTSLTYPNMAKNASFSSTSSLGVLDGFVYKGDFVKGVAAIEPNKAGAPTFNFNQRETAPATVSFKVTDEQGVESSSNASVYIKSGKLKVFDTYGNSSTLKVGLQAQYWSGRTWVLNTDDSCTRIPLESIVFAQFLNSKGAPASPFPLAAQSASIVNGLGAISLSSQTETEAGTVLMAVNLGEDNIDTSCLDTHPQSVGARVSWLRSNHSPGCPAQGDPFAKVTFGIYNSEGRNPIIYQKDVF